MFSSVPENCNRSCCLEEDKTPMTQSMETKKRIFDSRDTVVTNILLKAILPAGSKYATILHVILIKNVTKCHQSILCKKIQ